MTDRINEEELAIAIALIEATLLANVSGGIALDGSKSNLLTACVCLPGPRPIDDNYCGA